MFLASPAYDEEVMSDTDQEQMIVDGYPNKDDREKSFSMVPVFGDCESDPGENHEGEKGEPHLLAILALRFSPFNFSAIAGYPHPVPDRNEWDDYLLRFRGSEHDDPGKHLFNFHRCMLEHDFVHEDVLIKMFKFSLEGDAREWCKSLPTTSIHSLKDFHDAFNAYYEKSYLSHLILGDYCKKFAFYIQQMIESFSCDESGEDLIKRESKDKSEYFAVVDEIFSLSISQEEGLLDMIDDSVDDCIAIDALYSSPGTPVVSYLKEEMVVEEDSSLFLQEVPHDVFSPGIEEKNLEVSHFPVQNKRVVRSPIFDEYSDEEEKIPTSHFVDLGSNQPVYDSYESDSDVEISHPGSTDDIQQHVKEKHPVTDIHEEIPCPHLADVIGADKEKVDQQPASSFHSPVLATDIQPEVSSRKTEHVFCYQPSRFCHLFYDPVGQYMEWHFFQVLNPPKFILPSALGGGLKNVIDLLSQFHYLLLISDRVNKFSVRRLLDWLWWKSTFT
jgi:hypothetical protein